MKRFIIWMLSLFTVLIVIVGVLIFVGIRSFTSGESESISQNTLLVLDWSDRLPGHQVPLLEQQALQTLSFSNLIPALRQAIDDPRIKGLLIEGHPRISRVNLHELSVVLEDFRAAGKAIHAHISVSSDSDYLLSCLADRLSMSGSSAAGLIFTGSAIHLTYRRELADKLGLKMRVRHVGEAKGFGESWVRDGMSEPVRENLGLLVEDRQRLLCEWVAQRRGIDAGEFRGWIEAGDRFMFSAEEALELGLVDVLENSPQWESYLKENYGDFARLSIQHYVQQESWSKDPGSAEVAVLWAEGNIVPGRKDYGSRDVRIFGDGLVEQIQDLKDDDDVRAVVLRVESPGGVVLPSEEIYEALKELAASKSLLVSMGGVAASGGYYISMPAELIYADPWTVTGSIGVVAMLPDLSESYGKLGLHKDGIFTTPVSRMVPGMPIEDGMLDALQKSMSHIYDVFRDRVLDNRPLNPEELGLWTEGRVWSARRAQSGGLVDSLGTLEDATRHAATLAGMESFHVSHYPQRENLLELFMKGKIKPGDLIPLLQASWLDVPLLGDLEKLEEDFSPQGPETWMRAQWLWEVNDQ